MSERKRIVESYFEGFRTSDHERILALLTDDVVWRIHGHRELRGKEAFDGEIENEAFDGSPELEVERMIEGDDAVVVPHRGRGHLAGGGAFEFAAVTVLSFDGELIAAVDSYVVPLSA